MSEPIFRVSGLRKAFGGLRATDDVSFEVDRAEFRAIIGPNGAGKSTLFNLCTGFLKADSGRVSFQGADITDAAPHRRFRAGMSRTFQISAVFADLTVLENVQAALLSHHRRLYNLVRPAAQQYRDEAAALIHLVSLPGDPARRAGVLSHGDQKKLELAVALANQPKILFLDEPTAGMAAHERLQAIQLVRKIANQRELTVVFTEHDMEVVFAVANTISVLHQGRIVAEGSPQDVRQSAEVQRIYLGDLDSNAS
jgi:branched-chain amino acid transport system ATP-binding protein